MLVPDDVTARTGIAPTRSFGLGEARRAAARKVAGSEWHSPWADRDADPVIEEFVRLFRPHARVFRAAVDAGADATLSVVGEVLGDFVSSAEEADAKPGPGAKVRPSAHSSLLSAQSWTSTMMRFYCSPT